MCKLSQAAKKKQEGNFLISTHFYTRQAHLSFHWFTHPLRRHTDRGIWLCFFFFFNDNEPMNFLVRIFLFHHPVSVIYCPKLKARELQKICPSMRLEIIIKVELQILQSKLHLKFSIMHTSDSGTGPHCAS